MLIERLRLVGFKSFVEPTELIIAPGLTGVVGPNGCGKSNLLEAIRWAMGESSARSMRGGGMDDVIFAGTETRPSRDFAEVALVCDSEGEPLPALLGANAAGPVEIVRRIERGAGSAYRANGQDVRARDVALLFADAATGAHSPALVSQGKVASIIAARPQERRQLLEEAAGIAGLHVRRKDAEQKLRATETNLARLADILADMDQRSGALRRQARAAERYTALSDAIRIAEARMIFARWRDAAALADTARSMAIAAEAQVSEAQRAQESCAAVQAETLTVLAQARAAAARARDAEVALATRVQHITAERDMIVRRLADIANEQARITRDRDAEDALAREGAAAIERLEGVAHDAARDLASRDRERPDLNAFATHAADTLRDAEVALAQARADQANEAAERRIATAAEAEAQRRVDRATRERDRILADLARAGDAAALERTYNAATAAVAAALHDQTRCDAALVQASADSDAIAAQQATASDALSAARATLSALDNEVAALDRSLASARGTASAALDALRVDAGYEDAIAAALGDDLTAPLLTDDAASTGESAGWKGATPLMHDPALPAGTRPLAAMVQGPPALARRLAQIAVADRDDGQPLATGQRLVTRDGHMRRWDGFISHGSGAASAERLVRLNRRAALAAERAPLGDSVIAAEAQLATVVATRHAAIASVDNARAAARAADGTAQAAQRAAAQAEAALERCRSAATHLSTRLTEAAQDHADAIAAQHLTTAALAALPDGAASSARLATAQAQVERAGSVLSDCRARITALDMALAALREAQIEANAEVRGWRARTGEAARRLATMAAREAELADECNGMAGRPDALADAGAQAEARLASERAGLSELIAAEAGADQLVRAHDAALDTARETLANAREQRAATLARAEAAEARRIDMGRLAGKRFGCPPPLLPTQAPFDAAAVDAPEAEQAAHDRLVADRERIGPVNLVAAQELAEMEAAQGTSRVEAEELQLAVNRLRGSIGHLNREGRERLRAAFDQVDSHFRGLFSTLFGGGEAHLALTESDDPLEAGLEIMAQPPGKKLSTLTLLSGGEQALTAIALIFALFLTNPAPICVLDEVDAPLDDANVERFCDLLDRMSAETATRYLIVTHNAVTMARMHRLFGVTMVERGISRLVSVDLQAAEALVAA